MSSSAPRKMTRCVTCVFRNISNPPPRDQSLTYGTPFRSFCLPVPLRSVHLLSADSCKEHLATEAAPSRVSRSPWPPQRAPAQRALPGPEWHWRYEWLPRHSQWPDGHSRRWWSRSHADSHRRLDGQRCQSSCHPLADPAAELDPSAYGHPRCANWSSRLCAALGCAVASHPEAES